MSVAYVFPGQGAQRVGMGLDICTESAAGRNVFEEVDRALGFPLSRLCFEGPAETLKQTINSQPAVFAVSLACLAAARETLGGRLSPASRMAGHSLGEYTALVAAEALSLADGARLVRERGRLMQEAGEREAGGMIAVLGMEQETLKSVCDEAGVEIANLNCPGQIAISGSKPGLDRAVQIGQARGGKKFLPLEVSGAFHSRLMQPACAGLERAVAGGQFRKATVPIAANVTGQDVSEPQEIRKELMAQLCGCVRWQAAVEGMIARGCTTFIEFGPGQVLTGLIKRTSKEAKTANVGSMADLRNWKDL